MKFIPYILLAVLCFFLYRSEGRITDLEFKVQVLARDSDHLKTNQSALLTSQKRLGVKQRAEDRLLSVVAKAVIQMLDETAPSAPDARFDEGTTHFDNTFMSVDPNYGSSFSPIISAQ